MDRKVKVYVSKSSGVSMLDDGKISAFHPFFLVDEDKEHLFKNENYIPIDTILNPIQLKDTYDKIKKAEREIKETARELKEKTADFSARLDNYEFHVKDIENSVKTVNNIRDETARLLKSIAEEKALLEIKRRETDMEFENMIKTAEDLLRAASENITLIAEKAEQKCRGAALETSENYEKTKRLIRETADEFIKNMDALLVEGRKAADLSKQWACNPANIPIEADLYSARHYAAILKKERKER